MREMPTPSYHAASQFLQLKPSDFAYMSAWPRDNVWRQTLSLYLITWYRHLRWDTVDLATDSCLGFSAFWSTLPAQRFHTISCSIMQPLRILNTSGIRSALRSVKQWLLSPEWPFLPFLFSWARFVATQSYTTHLRRPLSLFTISYRSLSSSPSPIALFTGSTEDCIIQHSTNAYTSLITSGSCQRLTQAMHSTHWMVLLKVYPTMSFLSSFHSKSLRMWGFSSSSTSGLLPSVSSPSLILPCPPS